MSEPVEHVRCEVEYPTYEDALRLYREGAAKAEKARCLIPDVAAQVRADAEVLFAQASAAVALARARLDMWPARWMTGGRYDLYTVDQASGEPCHTCDLGGLSGSRSCCYACALGAWRSRS